MTHSPMSQNRVRDALETEKDARKAFDAWMGKENASGFDHVKPMWLRVVAALTAPPASEAAGAEGWPSGCIKPNACARHRNCVYAMGKSQCRHYGEDLTAAIAAAPTAPAQAPSRPVDAGGVEAASAAYYDSMIGPERENFPHHEGWAGKGEPFKAKVRDRMRIVLEAAALATQAPDKAGAREGLASKLAANLVSEIDGLISESEGVAGLHRNGDVAGWDELLPGGEYERLTSLEALRSALLDLKPAGTEASRSVGGEAPPCHWGGGNDIIWCSVCGEEYAYTKGEQRPPCPRTVISTPSAFSDSATSMAILPDREKLNRMARGGAASPTPPQADKPPIADVLAAVQDRNRIDPEHDTRVTDYAAIEAMGEDGAAQ